MSEQTDVVVPHGDVPLAVRIHRPPDAGTARMPTVVCTGSWLATDYTSVFGGEPETVDGPELATRWRALLPGFDATQHFLGPLLPAGENTVECNVRGHHALDHPHRELRDRAPRAGRAGAAPGRVTGDRVAAR